MLAGLATAGIEATSTDSGWDIADGAISLYTPSAEPDSMVEAITGYAPGHEAGGEAVFFEAGGAPRAGRPSPCDPARPRAGRRGVRAVA